ncbi:MAG: DNA/RNA non-specific endonuclease [Lachnospiraceae bacterium]|nr:DNA/RNA non-specific endonuclease [Lachnospiraceae bacterium]
MSNHDGRRKNKKSWGPKSALIALVLIIVFCVAGYIVDGYLAKNSQTSLTTGAQSEWQGNSQSDTQEESQSNSLGDGSLSFVDSDPSVIPDYSGEDYVYLNNNIPNFNEWDLENITGEHFSELDELGRCGTAYAMIDNSMMPTGERGEIGHIKPTGWVQNKYENIVDSEPGYLYNRSHLIAYALTGQNDNEQNLITGTRYMNATTMLPWEEMVMRYLDYSDNHVLYRVSPYFKDDELLSRGVEMEAYSVEDEGEGICYHVFIYNVQPGIELDYATGENWVAD